MHVLKSPGQDDPCSVCGSKAYCSYLSQINLIVICDECRHRAILWAAQRSLAEEKSQAKLTAMSDHLDEIKNSLPPVAGHNLGGSS
ncbi:hypothetical protein LCGC14_1536990 [marine sediment metagenome]|uniref:Uncharacterized protein n=1 Tax=marine sediment metagenome TaxID=412755 RepID=A0A0F9IUA1_9ZZZZ